MALQGIQNIRQFGNIIRDMSRPYLFLISIPYLDRDERVTAFARTSKLPGYKINTVEIPFQTQKWRIASTAVFEGTWEVEFLCDEGHSIRNKLIGWMQKAYDPSLLRNGAPIEYKTDNVKVVQLDRTSNTVVQYQFVGLFPSAVGDISVGQEDDQPEKFSCTFTYDYWTMAGAGASANASNFFLGISVETGNSGVSISTAASIATKIGTFGVNTSSVI
jgi:hypothetical protein